MSEWNYETTVQELEAIIQNIESGHLPLEDIFEQFEEAVQHLKKCEDFLNQGQERMTLLIETLDDSVLLD
ncbi:exodeoxyribonuclease VII small subunit [Spirulina subsalsa FACHB-351]|uniref:Exodeoxyribonuclease 7 small subunit n=1 Tax=Spirulina subsalsa FACHB-351 TaxID=234711 RepID=A0ABT3L318_9CYAN|nr:exodeoxyribonuclease VII small subunit [Spirulina subsalsa]MCW6035484.1 exodeoxyribonuclease VII small subunit [Spirulina subsalsa FACHB-351]